jgi:hypothetical protein
LSDPKDPKKPADEISLWPFSMGLIHVKDHLNSDTCSYNEETRMHDDKQKQCLEEVIEKTIANNKNEVMNFSYLVKVGHNPYGSFRETFEILKANNKSIIDGNPINLNEKLDEQREIVLRRLGVATSPK